MLTCSGGAGVALALLRQHPATMSVSLFLSSSSSTLANKSPLLLFSLKQCVHNKLTTLQQQCLPSLRVAVPLASRNLRYLTLKTGIPPKRDYHCCSLNLNNHHITFHYINSSIVTTSFTSTTTQQKQKHHQQQTRFYTNHQSSSRIIANSNSTCSSSRITNDNSVLLVGKPEHVDTTEETGDQNAEDELAVEEMLKEQVWSRAPALTPTFNVGAYANDSVNVRKLLQLGVDLSKWEPRYGAIPLLYKSNFETTMQPIIQ